MPNTGDRQSGPQLPNEMPANADAASDVQHTRADEPSLHLVLYQPEIPPNTGNIGRTCVALNAKLWLVRPIGFRLDSSAIKRSGMDYWQDLDWECADNWADLKSRLGPRRIWLVTKFAEQPYDQVEFERGDALVFGSESNGLPASIHDEYQQGRITIPMPGPVRCLNLATSAGIVAYEAARQIELWNPMSPTAAISRGS